LFGFTRNPKTKAAPFNLAAEQGGYRLKLHSLRTARTSFGGSLLGMRPTSSGGASVFGICKTVQKFSKFDKRIARGILQPLTPLFDGKMRQERLDFCTPHVFGVALVVKEDEATNPIHVGFLSPVGIMLEPNDISNLVEQFSGWMRHNRNQKLVHLY
jgi:hypothetical protein